MIDPLKQDLRRKEAEDVAADLRDDAIMHEEARLLREEFNPMTPENFAEAIREGFTTGAFSIHATNILNYMNKGMDDVIGHYLVGMSKGYWQAEAIKLSRKDM